MKTLPTIVPLILAAAANAQCTWFVRSGAAVRIVGASETTVRGVSPAPFTTDDGTFVVHFAADALGKPASLTLAEVKGASVHVAVAVAGPAPCDAIAMDAPAWREQRHDDTVARLLGGRDEKNVRVQAELRPEADAAGVGLLLRVQEDGGHYRYEWDRATREHRLLRRMGGNDLVLARAPGSNEAPHVVAFVADGFRLQVCCDDAVVLQVLDGGFENGLVGTWQRGGELAWSSVSIGPPATPRGSAAVVQVAGRATLHSWVPFPPGSLTVAELQLDRPHALVPTTSAGELWVLQPLLAPVLARGDWRNSLGADSIGEVDRDGTVRCTVELPPLVALRGAACLLRVLVADAEGEAISGATPFVPLWWPSTPR